MKLPTWVIGIVSTLITAAMIGGFAWAWNLNAATASNKATVDFLNTKVIDNKVTTNADIKDLKDVIMEMKKENTDAHKEIKDMIYRMNRRNERQQ
jgi:hypothetical protein